MLKTEMRNPHTLHIDKMSTAEMVEAINRENYSAVRAVEAASAEIEAAVDMIADAFQRGHRLFYIGAGTSGRLGVLDAVECPPTYGVSPEMVVGILAGGEKCMFRSSEGAEDSGEAGIRDVSPVQAGDVIVGISVAGGASYVAEALREAKRKGAKTIALTSNNDTKIEKEADLTIITDTGAEVITGSTRMKAGTAHKLVLNTLSTCAMVKTGKVYENMMVNLKPVNIKLTARMVRIVQEITGLSEIEAEALLEENNWKIPAAINDYGRRADYHIAKDNCSVLYKENNKEVNKHA